MLAFIAWNLCEILCFHMKTEKEHRIDVHLKKENVNSTPVHAFNLDQYRKW